MKGLQGPRRCFAGPVFGTFSSLLNSTWSRSVRYQRGIVSVMERGNRPLLTKAALRLSSSMTAWIKKNPDTLPCICNSGLGFGPRKKKVLRILVAGFIHLNRESMLG